MQCTVATAVRRSANVVTWSETAFYIVTVTCEPWLRQHVSQLKFVNQLKLRQAHVCLQVHECKPSPKHAEANCNLE